MMQAKVKCCEESPLGELSAALDLYPPEVVYSGGGASSYLLLFLFPLVVEEQVPFYEVVNMLFR